MKKYFLLTMLLGGLLCGCQTKKSFSPNGTEILWDEWGVPHIYSDNNNDLMYAYGWAQMHNHGNLILELLIKSRGQGAQFFGEEQLTNDMIVHSLRIPEKASAFFENKSDEMKGILSSFAQGANDYAQAYPDKINPNIQAALPITEADLLGHTLFVIGTRFVGGGDLGLVSNWKELGSNTYAVSAERSASGNTMLVQNPHLPWVNEFTWMEAHLHGPDANVYGATLVGLPGLGIAFNEHLGWAHTNNTIDNADTYELTLQDDGYVLDGEVVPFDVRMAKISVKQEDGSLVDQDVPLLDSKHGPVVRKGETKALAIRVAGLENANLMDQWWQMGIASNFEEFEAAIKPVDIPFFNIMYADVEGNIFYMFNGKVPVRSEDAWDFWRGVVPGDRSDLIWQDYHTYDDLPKVKNPEQGWLQNANDPPWTSTIPMALDADDFPGYMAPRSMAFRPQRSARMLMEDDTITFDELVAYKLSTRMELADRILDDLFAAAATNADNTTLNEAIAVLQTWDRQANTDSKGAVLFYSWYRTMQFSNQATFETPWSEEDPMNTPDGLANPEVAVAKLIAAAEQVKQIYGSLDVAWGEAFRLRRGDIDLPANGADGGVGIFRVTWPSGYDNSQYTIGGGDSWVSIIEFGDEIKAKVLLSYGNATQADSPHNGDQLQLYSDKDMRDAYFYRQDVEAHVQRTEVLVNGKMTTPK
ncbi:MAG: acylase [Saprospiraceae bacterium]|nr:acylase [Saprospiraceae bacterium]